LKPESGKTEKVSFISAVKYKDGIFDRNSFIHVNEVRYGGLDEVFTHVPGWDIALSQVETYFRVVFHSRDNILKTQDPNYRCLECFSGLNPQC